MSRLPTLFVTHGSPMLAVNPEKTGALFQKLGQTLKQKKIKSIVVLSAHWLTPHRMMMNVNPHLSTLHDFRGFPNSLYQQQYAAKNGIDYFDEVQQYLLNQNIDIGLEESRGLDHGVWVPMQYLFPQADIPIIQLSIPWPMKADNAIQLGKKLALLRDEGYLLMTSGSMTHNLYDVCDNNGESLDYIKPFTDWVKEKILSYDLDSLIYYRELAPYAQQAHPTEEHFLPLLIALGASDKNETVKVLESGVTYQALAMEHYLFGEI